MELVCIMMTSVAKALLVEQDTGEDDAEFAIVFAAMGVNMETAHFFKQVRLLCSHKPFDCFESRSGPARFASACNTACSIFASSTATQRIEILPCCIAQ